MRIAIIVSIAIILLALAVFAQQPAPKVEPPIALSEAEQREAAAARSAVEQAQADRSKAWQIIQQTPVTDAQRCVSAVAVAQQVEQRIVTVEAEQRATLAQHRANHSCATCEYAPDGKTLLKSKPSKE